MREVRLYGALAKFVGERRFVAEISSAGEAIRMLVANFPGLEQHMAERHYKVIVDNYESDLDQINHPASQTIKFVPVLGAAASTAIGAIGTAMILGGVSQLLTPTPQIGSFGPASVGNARSRNTSTQATELDPQESYSFSGIQNTSRQGTPVPVVYGETIVGSVVISAGIDVDDI